MRMRLLIILAAAPWLAAWTDHALPLLYAGRMPDRPGGDRASSYEPIGAGIKSYTPVEPMPWGDVNKRVAPQEKPMPAMPGMKEMH